MHNLALLAAAAGLPYVGFGFVDNCVMVSGLSRLGSSSNIIVFFVHTGNRPL